MTQAKQNPTSVPDAIKELKEGRDATATVQKWDRVLASQEAAEGGTFAESLAKHAKSPAWAAFARETFSKLYDSGLSSEIKPEDRPDGSDWVSRLHESADALPEMRALKARAQRDAWASAVACGEALNVLAETVTPPESEPQAIQDEIDFVKSLMAEGGKASKEQLARLAMLSGAKKDAIAEHARASAMLAAKASSTRSAMRRACMQASETIAEFDGAMATLGAGGGDGIMSRTNTPPAQMRAMLLNNKELRKILKLAGRMKSAAIAKQRTKARPGCEELCDVKLGSDLSRILPSEMVNLATPDTEALLYRKLMENAAPSYELRGKETKAEGPIIMLVDESGSMSGEPDSWAKAVAIAIMEIAARQNRPFIYVHFNTRVARTDEFPAPKSIGLKQIEELASYFAGGGTKIAVALDHAADMLDKAKAARGDDKPWKRADVILVSDGDSHDTDAQTKAIERIRSHSGHLYTILIGYQSQEPCATMADQKLTITNDVIRSGDPSKLDGVFSI